MAEERRPDLLRLGRQLADARRRRGWKLADVADRLGRPLSRVSEIETGKVNSSVAALTEAGDALGLSLVFIPNDKLEQVMSLISEPRKAARAPAYDVKTAFSETFLDDAEPEGEEPKEPPFARR
ncbi:helix-turn-helix transcriptional regulator [Bosea sp. ANAM02]|uniref:helix-turn-helix domain-containing protein n=1 Tax=Bosea sp. ANAM02 TaxID=2020412 RepID=UPI00140EFB03|nr:helix-turn-helix transcriptional regulator [Bosea sp. ANAM02]BCB22184.1 hypothetical protein OCUBac02_50780 [Bosea sp. ANAM02]